MRLKTILIVLISSIFLVSCNKYNITDKTDTVSEQAINEQVTTRQETGEKETTKREVTDNYIDKSTLDNDNDTDLNTTVNINTLSEGYLVMNGTVGVYFDGKNFRKLYNKDNVSKSLLYEFNGNFIGYDSKRNCIPIINEVRDFEEFVRAFPKDRDGNEQDDICLSIKCDWDVQPNNIEKLEPVEKYLDIIESKLKENSFTNTPPILKDILKCDLDNNGVDEIILHATNFSSEKENDNDYRESILPDNGLVLYNLIYIISDDNVSPVYEMFMPIDKKIFSITDPNDIKNYLAENSSSYKLGDIYDYFVEDYYSSPIYEYRINDESCYIKIKDIEGNDIEMNLKAIDIMDIYIDSTNFYHIQGLRIFNLLDINNDGIMEIVLTGKKTASPDIEYFNAYRFVQFNKGKINIILDIQEDYITPL